jgi:hemoglobin-like flavoprotein
MTARQKQLVRQTFAQLETHSSVAALLFYRHLFTLDPSLRDLFRTDIEAQGRKLFDALAFIVGTLDAPQTQRDALASLGRRHASYGVHAEHYDVVREALLWMFQEDLGPAFSPEARQAWETVYGMISSIMKQAASDLYPSPERSGTFSV